MIKISGHSQSGTACAYRLLTEFINNTANPMIIQVSRGKYTDKVINGVLRAEKEIKQTITACGGDGALFNVKIEIIEP